SGCSGSGAVRAGARLPPLGQGRRCRAAGGIRAPHPRQLPERPVADTQADRRSTVRRRAAVRVHRPVPKPAGRAGGAAAVDDRRTAAAADRNPRRAGPALLRGPVRGRHRAHAGLLDRDSQVPGGSRPGETQGGPGHRTGLCDLRVAACEPGYEFGESTTAEPSRGSGRLMKRPLSPFEQELVNAMDEYAHRAVPPPFNATRIVARERQRVRVRLSIAAVCVATAAGIASCVATSVPSNGNKGLPVVGDTNTPVSVTASPTPGSSTASASPASSGGGAVGGKVSAGPAGTVPIWPTGATSSPFAGSVPPVPEVTSIRVGAHPEGGYDRISLEFTGQAPGFRAGYVAQVIRQGSGAPVSLPGAAFLQLTFSSAQA